MESNVAYEKFVPAALVPQALEQPIATENPQTRRMTPPIVVDVELLVQLYMFVMREVVQSLMLAKPSHSVTTNKTITPQTVKSRLHGVF